MENMKLPACLLLLARQHFVNKHGSVVVFLSKCLDLIVVYVLNGGHPTPLKQEKSAKQSKDLLLPSEPTNTGQ